MLLHDLQFKIKAKGNEKLESQRTALNKFDVLDTWFYLTFLVNSKPAWTAKLHEIGLSKLLVKNLLVAKTWG